MKWYVLQVRTGEELSVLQALHRHRVTAVVPRENRLIRSGGKWINKVYTLMTGYVFVLCDYTDRLYYIVRHLPSVLRWLTADGKPAALSDAEASFIDLYRQIPIMEPSVMHRTNDRWIVDAGPLIPLGDYIVRVDRHARRAYIRLPIFSDSDKTVSFSVIIQ